MFKVLPIHRRTLDRLLHVDRVFWMNAFENKFHRRFRRSVILEDPRGFLGPADLTGRNAPAEAAGATYSLGLMQRGLAPPQGLFGSVAFLDVDRGSIPLNDVVQLIAQRHVADQQPAIVPSARRTRASFSIGSPVATAACHPPTYLARSSG